MVLDVKVMTWAGRNGLDTAKLKAARVPIYGKWYFPDLPTGTPLVNLETGETQTFREQLQAGEVLWVAVRDLRRANLLPESLAGESDEAPPPPAREEDVDERPLEQPAVVEPLLAMARSPFPSSSAGEAHATEDVHAPAGTIAFPQPPTVVYDSGDGSGIHLPLPSIAPFVLAVGITVALLGAIVHPILLLVGIAWVAAGGIAWVRIGLIESRAAAHADHH